LRRLTVALVCNTRRSASEFEVEYDPPETIELIRRGILDAGHDYAFVEADEKAYAELSQMRPDLVFNRAEGIRGESRESHIPAFLEMLGIPFVGSNVLTTAICLDKPATKKILSYHRVPTPSFKVFHRHDQPIERQLPYPVLLKPSREGSSIGIDLVNLVHSSNELRRRLTQMIEAYREPILAEQFIAGREFSVGLLGNQSPRVLPILEIDFSKFPPEVGTVYGQRAKTVYDSPNNYVCPASVTEEQRQTIESVATRAFQVLGCRDMARIDLRMDEQGRFFVLEVNPLPGLDYDVEKGELSFYPIMARAAGMTFSEMIAAILEAAIERYGLV